jgi:molybdopterin converting factor small subunit
MDVNVVVKFLGTFQKLSGKKSINLTFKNHLTVKDLLNKLTEIFPKFKEILLDAHLNYQQSNSLVIINGKEISALKGIETEVQDSSEIVFIPLIHGG